MSFQQRNFRTILSWTLREDGFYEVRFPEWPDAPRFTSRSRRKAMAYAYAWLAEEYLKPLPPTTLDEP